MRILFDDLIQRSDAPDLLKTPSLADITEGVLPVITYGSSVWGSKNIAKFETVYNKAMRNFLCVNTYTSNCCVVGDTGWYV